MTSEQCAARQAAANNSHAELLRELRAADKIIRNALQIMTPMQKMTWAQRNARDGVDGEGVTRANERKAVLDRAAGGAA